MSENTNGIVKIVKYQCPDGVVFDSESDAENHMNECAETACKRKPFNYPDFSKMDPNDPFLKVLKERRPYTPSDFKVKPNSYMIPDLRWTFDKQYGG